MKNFTLLLAFVFTLNTVFALDNDKNERSTLSHNVYFNTDKSALTAEEFQKLVNFIKATEDVDVERMVIYGFCDDRGSIGYNQKLSNERANAVRRIIQKYRNTTKQPAVVNANGKGEIALNNTNQSLFDDLRALNRRVTIAILPKKLIAGSFYSEDLKAGDLINLKNLKFKKGLRFLTPESIKTLKELTTFLVKRTDIFFTVNGHVCCTQNGRDSRDKQTGVCNLSVVRAKFIRDYLVKNGVEAKRIKHQGLAGKYNLGGDESEDRRVDLLIRYVSKL